MRQFTRFIGRVGRYERSFTEVQIMKFTKTRDQDSLPRPALTEPNLSTETTLIEVVLTGEPERVPLLAKGASA
jgi:hypothetical protein